MLTVSTTTAAGGGSHASLRTRSVSAACTERAREFGGAIFIIGNPASENTVGFHKNKLPNSIFVLIKKQRLIFTHSCFNSENTLCRDKTVFLFNIGTRSAAAAKNVDGPTCQNKLYLKAAEQCTPKRREMIIKAKFKIEPKSLVKEYINT